jgi:glycosyltransferase involved in cell wall biosynthesis
MNDNIKISVLTSLYRNEQFLHGYFDSLAKIEGKEQIEVLLLHNYPQESELEIINEYLPKLPFVRHVIIPEREGLYKTWNRGIALTQSEYITVWNVDDVRFPQSILQQAQALDENPSAAIAYGDIWVSNQYGVPGTFLTNSPTDNHKNVFFHSYHISCFQMWRKSIHQQIGYYDEQFKCSADFDFQIRASIHFPFVKVEEPLGIYLEDRPGKLSYNGLQMLENNIIHLRYGGYENLNLWKLKQAKYHYKQHQLLFYDRWEAFAEKSPLSKWHKLKGGCIAFFKTSNWMVRQIAKMILK